VVIDDRIAFVGGIDLSRWRWDSNAHKADDPRRIDPNGKPYPPFHDLMMLVEGDAARRLGDLARKRWRCAHGWRIKPVKNQQADPWPDLVKPGIKQQSIAIARTEPAFKEQQAVNEIRQLYLDAIAAASHSIYIENQYFTASCLANALCESLSNEEGPQVVLVLPLKTGGWLEQVTMDVLRARLLKRLAERGTVAVSLLRLVPIAPFAVFNFVAGASHLRFRQFLLGSIIGLAPGLGGITFFSNTLWAAITNPSWQTMTLAILTGGLLLFIASLIKRWLRTS